MRTNPSNSDDIIDSRDIIERITELEAERETLTDSIAMAREESGMDLESAEDELLTWNDDNGDELTALLAFAAEGEDTISDWRHGATLVRESYWPDYVQQFAEDIGAIDRKASWPMNCIDWEQAARELQYDYSCITFDGVDYWGTSA